MAANDIFVRTLLKDKVKLRPSQISKDIARYLTSILKSRYEGVCSHHGYIKPDSIELYKHSLGTVLAVSLNGDVEYQVQYYASVCNPSIGRVVKATVQNMNKFGVLAHTGVTVNNQFIPVIEIIIARAMDSNGADVESPLDALKRGDVINVQIAGKKFQLNEKKISAVGRLIVDSKHSATTVPINNQDQDDDHDDDVEDDEAMSVSNDDQDDTDEKTSEGDASETSEDNAEDGEDGEDEADETESEMASTDDESDNDDSEGEEDFDDEEDDAAGDDADADTLYAEDE